MPAEFAADALLRILESGQVASQSLYFQLLDAAGARAGEAQEPIQRSIAMGAHLDSRSGSRFKGLTLRLDKISLQLRTVVAALKHRPERARRDFEAIALDMPALSCDTNLVYELHDYYKTVGEVFNAAFKPGDRARGNDIVFLRMYSRLRVAPQIAPIADLLRSLTLTPDQLNEFVNTFAQDLAGLDSDDRSFSHDAKGDIESVLRLATTARSSNASVRPLLTELRNYLVRHVNRERCRDTVVSKQAVTQVLVTAFNAGVGALAVSPPISLISLNDIRPGRLLSGPDDAEYWESSKSRRLLYEFKALRWLPSGSERTDRGSASWDLQWANFLLELAKYRPTDEATSVDYFHQKAILLAELLTITPDNEGRLRVLTDFITFINEWDLNRDARAEWLFHARKLLDPTFRRSEWDRSKEVERQLRSNPVFALYLDVERITGVAFAKF